MKNFNHTSLDFDYMIGLAQSDPSEFERMRMNAIESYIATLPSERQQRMRRLQWRIDQERRNHTPMGACLKLSKMMWDHVLSPEGLSGIMQYRGREYQRKGKVIPFPAP